jgi:nucleoside-diphosphate-sugar epimerase
MPLNILIIGATGVIGAPITKAIISAKSSLGRIAILTSSTTVINKASEIGSLKSHGVEILTGDLSNEQDVKKAYHGEIATMRVLSAIFVTNRAAL